MTEKRTSSERRVPRFERKFFEANEVFTVIGNGVVSTIQDVVYVKPETFNAKFTGRIAADIEEMNLLLMNESRHCLLIGFGRWGSSDPWLGIQVNWSQISSARAIVEATLPTMNVELSQGSHLFHNLSSFQVSYFSVRHDMDKFTIEWDWLDRQEIVSETEFVRHVRLRKPLSVMVDGRTGRGVINHD